MLNSRLETFYQKIICEDFIVLYNLTNVAQLPLLELAILSSTSNHFGASKISVLQSFCAWKIATGQKGITTRARKSIALFNIRKEMLLGLKVTLRKKTLFDFLDKTFTFVLPSLSSSKSRLKRKAGVQKIELQSTFFLNEKKTWKVASSMENKKKPKALFLPSFLQEKQVGLKEVDAANSSFKMTDVAFLYKLRQSWEKQKNVDDCLFLDKNFSKKETDGVLTFEREKQKKYFYLLKKKWSQENKSISRTPFMISNDSALCFPEISALSQFFDSFSGFSLSISLKKFESSQLFYSTRERVIRNQLFSALGCPKTLEL